MRNYIKNNFLIRKILRFVFLWIYKRYLYTEYEIKVRHIMWCTYDKTYCLVCGIAQPLHSSNKYCENE